MFAKSADVAGIHLEFDHRIAKRLVEFFTRVRPISNSIRCPLQVDLGQQIQVTATRKRLGFDPCRASAVVVARVDDGADQVRVEEEPVVAPTLRIRERRILRGDLRACDRRDVLRVQRPPRASRRTRAIARVPTAN